MAGFVAAASLLLVVPVASSAVGAAAASRVARRCGSSIAGPVRLQASHEVGPVVAHAMHFWR